MLFRLFIKNAKKSLALAKENFHYLTRVLKLSIGDCFEVVEGTPEIKIFKINNIKKNELNAELQSSYAENNEAEIKLFLAQPMLKPEKLELILQKCTELGIYEFLLYCADKSPIEIKNLDNKLSRWEKIIEAAVCQSRRNYLPKIKVFNSLADLFRQAKPPFYFADRCSAQKIGGITVKELTIVVGPESGFSAGEKELLQKYGSPITLGRRTLRTETASIAVCSKILL